MATKIAEAYVEIKTNQAKFSKELKGMERTVKSSTDRMKRNFDRIGKGVSEMSRAARLGFIAMAAAIAGTVYAAAKYEKQMATVSTMLSRKSMPIMKKYKDLIGKMGIIFGESTETLSKGLYDILSASIAPEKALKVLAISAKAAAAGLTDTGVAADAITTIINSYGYAAKDAGKISDILFAIVKRGKTTFAELAPSIGKVAATAAIAGVSLEELGATLATITRAGIRTEEATTAMNGILRAFLKPTDDAAKAAKEFGFELNTNTLRTIGLRGVLELLTDATAEQTAEMFPNIRGLKGIAAAMQDLEGYTEDYKLMLESAGLTQEAYIKQTSTLTFAFNQLKEAGKYLAVQVGEIFTPIVSQAIKKITDQAIKLGQAIKGLTSDQKNSIAQMVLFGTAVLGAIGALSLFSVAAKLVMAAGSVIAGTLGLIFSPLGLLIVGIGALVLAWTLGWKKIKEITSKLVEIVIMPTIKFVGEKIENLADLIQEKLGIPEEARKGIWELTDITANIEFFVKLIWGGIVNVAGTIKDWVIGQTELDDPIGELIAKIADFLIELPEPTKWFFKIGTRIWQYASLGIGIWWTLKGLLSAIKFAPIALPALLPILVGIGLALVGIDVLGDKLKKKLDEAKVDELLTAFSAAYPSLFNLTVGIKEVTGLELPLLLAYIDEEWKGTAKKLSLILLTAQIPLKILFDIDLKTVFADFWEDTKEVLSDTWDRITWPVLSWKNFTATLSKAWDNTDWSWFGFDEVKDFFKDIWESFDWSWLNWENFVTALQEAWDNTDWGWFGNSIKWLMGLFREGIEEIEEIEIDWKFWDQADKQTRKAVENMDKQIDKVEEMYGVRVPKALVLAVIAQESSFNRMSKSRKSSAKGLGHHIDGTRALLKIFTGDWDDAGNAVGATIETLAQKYIDNNKDWKKATKKYGENTDKYVFNVLARMTWLAKGMKEKGKLTETAWRESFVDGLISGEKDVKKVLIDIARAMKDPSILKAFGFTGQEIAEAFKGTSPGLITGLEEANKDTKKVLDKMTGQMGKMVDGMSKIFMPIIDMFKMIFMKVISVIKEFDEEAGTELENFVNETLGAIEDMFGEIVEEAEGAGDDIGDDLEKQLSDWQKFCNNVKKYVGDAFKRMGEAAADYFSKMENWLADVLNAFTAVITGTKSFGQALLDLAYSIPVIGGIAEAIVGVVTAFWDWVTGAAAAKQAMADMLEDISEATGKLSEAFKDVGASLTGSINEAERAIRNLMQTQEELAMSTREKLIKELDNYYDYRILREMDLTQLLALSAETRGKLEKGTLEEIAETAEEVAEREKDAKVGTLKAIEDAYKKESKLIDKKIKLIGIEIKLMMAAALAEQGKLEEAAELTREANYELGRLLYTQEEIDKQVRRARDNMREWGRTGREAADNARIGIELWGEEINKIPRRIDFDIVAELHMPRIPRLGTQYFDIVGQYRAPDIPSYQVGIPYVPRTHIAELHPKEAVLTAPQAENWRAGKGGAGGGTKVVYERGAIRMTVMGNLNNQVDLEEAMDYLAKKQTEKMRRP